MTKGTCFAIILYDEQETGSKFKIERKNGGYSWGVDVHKGLAF